MMRFGVRRLDRGDGIPAGYHLYDQSETLLYVADPGFTTEPDTVRFAYPDGSLRAMMNAPQADEHEFALVQDFAVYAMLNRLTRPEGTCLIFEVASERWLVRPVDDGFDLYDSVPAGYPTFLPPEPVPYPDACGRIQLDELTSYQFSISLESHRWWQVGLVMLAVITVLDAKLE